MSNLYSEPKRRRLASPKAQLEKIVYTYGIGLISANNVDLEGADQLTLDMEHSVVAVEAILAYKFKDKTLLQEALTHSSYTEGLSYERLEFLGDSALGHAVSKFLYLTYPHLDPGQLSLLRAANISTEKLARVAIKHGLYKYVRHRASALSDKVREFVISVEEEEEMVVHGGEMKAPKVLADVVEAVAAAVYVDCKFDLESMWMVIRKLLEPLVMQNVLEKQPQPITMLFETCQKDGSHVDIRHRRKGDRNIATVYVDGRFVASGSSDNKDNAKLHAAEVAVSKLTRSKNKQVIHDVNEATEIEGAKQKVYDLCGKKRWPKPTYRVENESGPAHERRYISSVQIEFSDRIILVKGDEMNKVKGAENSAASKMLCALQDYGSL